MSPLKQHKALFLLGNFMHLQLKVNSLVSACFYGNCTWQVVTQKEIWAEVSDEACILDSQQHQHWKQDWRSSGVGAPDSHDLYRTVGWKRSWAPKSPCASGLQPPHGTIKRKTYFQSTVTRPVRWRGQDPYIPFPVTRCYWNFPPCNSNTNKLGIRKLHLQPPFSFRSLLIQRG